MFINFWNVRFVFGVIYINDLFYDVNCLVFGNGGFYNDGLLCIERC